MGYPFVLAMQGVGAKINAGSNAVAADFAQGAGGILALVTVVAALVIISGIGGQGLQKPVRQYFLAVFIGTLLLKGYATISTGTLSLF